MADVSQGNCRRCKKVSETICLRCGDYYCSKLCQEVDWPQHRYICFPKPPLVSSKIPLKDGNAPEIGLVKQIHLKENLRQMALVCQEFIKQMEEKSECEIENFISAETLSNIPNVLKSSAFDETSIQSKPIESDDINNNKQEQNNNKKETQVIPLDDDSNKNCTQLHTNDNEKNEDQIVYLTSFRATNRVGVCPKNYIKDNSYQQVLDKIDEYGKNAPHLKQTSNFETYVVTKRAGRFARAKIISHSVKETSSSRIRIEFIDYGNLAFRKLFELHKITQELIDLPVYTKIFELSNVDLVVFDYNFLRFLSSFEKRFYKMIINSKSQYSAAVELFDLETGEKLNELISKGCTSLTQPYVENRNVLTKEKTIVTENLTTEKNTELMPILKAPFKEHIFPISTRNKKAVILDLALAELGFITCMFEEHKSTLNKIQTYLSELEKSDKPYKPVSGEYVIAQFKGEWRRGKVMGILPSENYEILFTDFLNEATLTSEQIRRYPEELTIDSYVTLCMIAGLPARFPSDIKEFMKTEIKVNDVIEINRVFEIMDGNVAFIQCDELIERMCEKKLI